MANKKLNRIKSVLADKDKTSKWLAEELGKDKTTISKWCTNTNQPGRKFDKNFKAIRSGSK